GGIERDARTGGEDCGVAMVTSRDPALRAASPARQAAPVLPGEPAKTSTFPASPLFESGARRDDASHEETIAASTSERCEPAAWINSSGEPIGATTSLQLRFDAGGKTFPILRAVNVPVSSARTAPLINSLQPALIHVRV